MASAVRSLKNKYFILEESKESSRIFFPLSLAQLMQVSITVCSNLALGGIGVEALASGGICNILIQTGVVIVQSAISSFQSLFGQAQGRGDRVAERFVGCACIIALILSVFLLILLILIILFCRAYVFEATMGQGALLYMSSAVFATPGMVFFSVMRSYASASRKAASILKAVGCGVFFYGVCAAVVVMFFRSVTEQNLLMLMGVIFSLSWTVVAIISFLSLDILSVLKRTLSDSNKHIVFADCLAILSAGWPVGLGVASEMSANTMLAMFVGASGVTQMSVHQLCQSIELLTFMPSLAMSQAVSVRVAYFHGKGEAARIRLVHRVAVTFILLVAFAEVALIMLFHDAIYKVSIVDTGELAASFGGSLYGMFIAVCGIVVFDALQAASSGALRGQLDMKIPMLMAVASYWIVGFVFAMILARLTPQPVLGVWAGICIGVFCSACLQTVRFVHLNRLRSCSLKK
ncbi:MATE family efflux transporter [Acetobacter sp.]|jgi:MATE family multidrug resistance protein|uniref:MATE family efflux transporter n=1 Tax=Acetobacter sp. TaxID=440 RepID=UPI0025C40CF2|nr:MATE family efflux transporter [Acetobacter sp.]MCH4092327.1 hypothetical protein [Acetobacter sp.]MCI1300997.1 MATE family efflux transporter [Acetobacter sp.]MCI1317231.1 MATE family efflux transporter [Acetobacter sp.]